MSDANLPSRVTTLENSIFTGTVNFSRSFTISKSASYTQPSGTSSDDWTFTNFLMIQTTGTVYINSISINNINLYTYQNNRAYATYVIQGVGFDGTIIKSYKLFTSTPSSSNTSLTLNGQSFTYSSPLQPTASTHYLQLGNRPYSANSSTSITLNSSTVTITGNFVLGSGGINFTVL